VRQARQQALSECRPPVAAGIREKRRACERRAEGATVSETASGTVIAILSWNLIYHSAIRSPFWSSRREKLSKQIQLVTIGSRHLFRLQGVVSLIDATLIFVALSLLGVENPLLLSVVVFVFSFVPVIGVIISAVPIAIMALVQTNGSFGLALWALGAVLLVHLIEATVLSPRIVGKMLHLHPVLGIVVLGIAQQFFGIWGLLLAYPVTVFLIFRVLGPNGNSPRPPVACDRTPPCSPGR
jgi:predicted PurR-regulated permease PerM